MLGGKMHEKAVSELRSTGVVSRSNGKMSQSMFSLEDAFRVELMRRLTDLGIRPQVRVELMKEARKVNWDEVDETPVSLRMGTSAELVVRLDGIRSRIEKRVNDLFGGVYTPGQLETMGISLSSEAGDGVASLAEEDQDDAVKAAMALLAEHDNLDEEVEADTNTEAADTSDEPATTDDEDDEWWLEDDLEALP